jgi:hypothetical protein
VLRQGGAQLFFPPIPGSVIGAKSIIQQIEGKISRLLLEKNRKYPFLYKKTGGGIKNNIYLQL